MPQLQVQRNVIVLLGSYLANLNLQLQRLAPLMSRTGDLMQRESLMTGQAERQLTQEMANQIGAALEDVSRAAGSVAHFYRTLKVGASGAEATVEVGGYSDSFKAMIQEVGSIQGMPAGSASQSTQPSQAPPAAPPRPKSPEIIKVDIVEKLKGVIQPPDMINFMMGKYDALAHIPAKTHDALKEIQQKNCAGSIDNLAKMLAASVTDKLQTEKVQESIHEGFDPILNINELLVEHGKRGIEAVYEGGRDQPFATFFAKFKETGVDALGKVMEEVEEGFVNGEEDVWAFVEYNLTE